MRAIDRKLLRDLWAMRGQAAAIGFVMVAGVAAFVSMTSLIETLEKTLESYYEAYGFPDGFAAVTRAPEQVADQLRAMPGVRALQTRVSGRANLNVPGFGPPITATIHSIPEDGQPALNRLFLREGRWIEPGREDEVLLSEVFAEAHDLLPGDTLTAIIRGSRRTVTVAGVVLTPEHLWQVEPGTIVSDPETYGVLWMGRGALGAAYEMEGAFNDLAFTRDPGYSLEDVIQRVDLVLDRYGGLGAYGRDGHPSHTLVRMELDQLSGMASLLPVIFLGVAAFLLNIVVMRMIALQREQIAVLKAFGYRNRDVGLHYVKLVLAIGAMGAVAGVGIGVWLGRVLSDLFLEYFRFPALEYTVSPGVIGTAVMLTMGASLVGVLQAVWRAIRLPPAEAMRPAPPASFRPTFIERLGLQRAFDQPTRIIMRNIERQPLKALFTVFGISISGGLLIMGLFSTDAIDHMIDVQYGVVQREDVTVSFIEPTSRAAAYELQHLQGVVYQEPFRSVPVRLWHEHRSHQTAIEGVPPGSYLRRVIDDELRPVAIPADGVILTEGVAGILRAAEGDRLRAEILEGRREIREVPVVGVTTQYIGSGVYMSLDAANRLAGSGNAISGALLMIDEAYESTVNEALRDRPGVASIVTTDLAMASFLDDSAGLILAFSFVLALFAGVIAFGVVYNSIRISLSERDRELASLRVLGFTRGEISYILLGEAFALVLLAIPLGFLLGTAGSVLVADSVQTEIMTIPLVLARSTYALSAVVILAAALLSAALIRRRLNRLDLIAVLKTRE